MGGGVSNPISADRSVVIDEGIVGQLFQRIENGSGEQHESLMATALSAKTRKSLS